MFGKVHDLPARGLHCGVHLKATRCRAFPQAMQRFLVDLACRGVVQRLANVEADWLGV